MNNTMADGTLTTEWRLVVSYLHYTGENKGVLTSKELDAIWVLADGFGPQTLKFVRETEYDWSHIRDSSPEAIHTMSEAIQNMLKQKEKMK